jgi:hypothetical protein
MPHNKTPQRFPQIAALARIKKEHEVSKIDKDGMLIALR